MVSSNSSSPYLRRRRSRQRHGIERMGGEDDERRVKEDEEGGGRGDEGEGRLNIGIVGFGNFGQFLANTMRHGNNIFASSRSDYTKVASRMGVKFYRDVNEMLRWRRNGPKTAKSEEGGEEEGGRGLDVLLISTSVLSFSTVLSKLCPKELKRLAPLVVDVLSVKEHARREMLRILPSNCDILCTHPMFGPESGKHGW